MNIAICEDSLDDIEKIESIFVKMKNHLFHYDVFLNAEELLLYKEKTHVKYNLYILDIEMEGINGFDLARIIRESDLKALIVFLTNYAKYMYEAFDIITFDFILKPIQHEKMNNVIEKAMNYLNLTNNFFTFSYRKKRYVVKCDEILYIEKYGRQALIYTVDNKYKTNMKLADIWKQLNEKVFAHISGSIIVNLEYIRKINREEINLKNGIIIYMSRLYKKNVRQKHLEFVTSKM